MSPYRARGDNVSSTSGEVDIGTSEPEGADVPDPSVNQGILGPYDDCRLPNALRGHEVPCRHCGRRGWTGTSANYGRFCHGSCLRAIWTVAYRLSGMKLHETPLMGPVREVLALSTAVNGSASVAGMRERADGGTSSSAVLKRHRNL